jgi:hypothetical protein
MLIQEYTARCCAVERTTTDCNIARPEERKFPTTDGHCQYIVGRQHCDCVTGFSWQ